jgi:hypothetical protein
VKYQLVYEYIHCAGKTSRVAGVVQSEEEARRWVEENSARERVDPALADPACSCPVTFCAMRSQKPVFSYLGVEDAPETDRLTAPAGPVFST